MSIVTVTKENFNEEVLGSKQPVLLDFWAPWCMHCQSFMPVIDEIAAENAGIKVCKVNADEQPELVAKFEVSSIPALFVIKDGKITSRSKGVRPKYIVEDMIK